MAISPKRAKNQCCVQVSVGIQIYRTDAEIFRVYEQTRLNVSVRMETTRVCYEMCEVRVVSVSQDDDDDDDDVIHRLI